MSRIIATAAAVAAVAASGVAAQDACVADQVSIVAVDLDAEGQLSNAPNSVAARAALEGVLANYAVNGFEDLPVCSTPGCSNGQVLTFGDLGTATISSTGGSSWNHVTNVAVNHFAALEGSNGYGLSQGEVTFTFSQPQQVVGFFINDIVDYRGVLTIKCASGATEDIEITPENVCGEARCPSGSVAFVGSARNAGDETDYCTSLTITATGGHDGMMYDSLLVGSCPTNQAVGACENDVVTFFAADPAAEGNLDAAPRSKLARAQFDNALAATFTQDFESATACNSKGCSDGSVLSLGSFGFVGIESSSASSTSFNSISNAQVNHLQAVSGSNGYAVGQDGSVTFTFSQPQQAVGFYLNDAFEGTTVTIGCESGATESVSLSHSDVTECTGSECPSGTLSFWGTIRNAADASDYCTSITFSVGRGSDTYMIDDLVVGACIDEGLIVGSPCQCYAVDCGCQSVSFGASGGSCARLVINESPADPDNLNCDPTLVTC